MAVSVIGWLGSYLKPAAQRTLGQPNFRNKLRHHWALFAPNMALSVNERAAEAEHYKVAGYGRNFDKQPLRANDVMSF